MTKQLWQFVRREDGPTAVEYAILLALLVGMMVAAVTFVGNEIKGMSDHTVDALDSKLNG